MKDQINDYLLEKKLKLVGEFTALNDPAQFECLKCSDVFTDRVANLPRMVCRQCATRKEIRAMFADEKKDIPKRISSTVPSIPRVRDRAAAAAKRTATLRERNSKLVIEFLETAGFNLVGEYTDSKTKITVRCHAKGHIDQRYFKALRETPVCMICEPWRRRADAMVMAARVCGETPVMPDGANELA